MGVGEEEKERETHIFHFFPNIHKFFIRIETEQQGEKQTGKNARKILRITHSRLFLSLKAPLVPSGAPVVEVMPPALVDSSLNVVAIGVVRQHAEIPHGNQVIVPVHHLQVPKVGGHAEALSGEVAAAHLRAGVGPGGPRVDDLAAELHHGRVVGQPREEEGGPVSDQKPGPELQPPVSVLGVLTQ